MRERVESRKRKREKRYAVGGRRSRMSHRFITTMAMAEKGEGRDDGEEGTEGRWGPEGTAFGRRREKNITLNRDSGLKAFMCFPFC